MKNYEHTQRIAVNKVIEGETNEIKDSDEVKATKVNQTNDEYLGIIDIPKIGLRRYLYKTTSALNNVDKNIEVLKSSTMPDKGFSNLILAAHNGNSSVGHFKNLHKLNIGDYVKIYYKDKLYNYKIAKKYDVLKTGKVAIRRDRTKNTLTLITCLGSDRQLVVIGYLEN